MYELTSWLKKSRRWAALLVLLGSFSGNAQPLTLQAAYDMARENYPLIKQKGLIRQTAGLNISNISKGWLPQVTVNGQATYQSEVTSVNVSIPGVTIEAPEKDQYKLTADISQVIYDGGMNREQKVLQQLGAAVEEEQVEVELYKVKERVNQVFLSLLYLDEQVRQVELVKKDLLTGAKKVEAQVTNGVAFRSNLLVLQAESIKADQRLIELNAARRGLVETLGLFINRKLDENIQLAAPTPGVVSGTDIARPEMNVFSLQGALLDQQFKIIRAKNLPKTSLFVQGGYGRPGLNMLKNEFDPFYIGGVRFNWSLGGLYTRKNDMRLVKISQAMVDTRKQAFLLNTHTQLSQQQSELNKQEALIATDSLIINIRKSITDAAKAQLENGVITANDYLREVNAEDQSRQQLIAHRIQLLQAKINYQTITGK